MDDAELNTAQFRTLSDTLAQCRTQFLHKRDGTHGFSKQSVFGGMEARRGLARPIITPAISRTIERNGARHRGKRLAGRICPDPNFYRTGTPLAHKHKNALGNLCK